MSGTDTLGADDYAEVEWTGSESAVIESETNPWLRDASGADMDLLGMFGNVTAVESACGECGPIPGVIAPMDTEYGIQACDACDVYPGDLHAARALADHIGAGASVWFHGVN